jgi:predicted nucleic acid-binding protein
MPGPDRKSVYVETSIPSYLTARPSRDLITAARQELTREWWEVRREKFDLFTSELVVLECSRGDQEMAVRRLAIIENLSLVEIGDEARRVAERLTGDGPMPDEAVDDALHLALAAVHGMDFLLTWNCRHLANSEMTGPVAEVIRRLGHTPPVICTPETLMGEEP